jgi:hypothetical protein
MDGRRVLRANSEKRWKQHEAAGRKQGQQFPLIAFVRRANAKQGDQNEGGDAASNDTKETDIKSLELGDGKPGRCGRQREQRDCLASSSRNSVLRTLP